MVVASQEAKECIKKLLVYVGEDPDREGLRETPSRVLRAFEELFRGYKTDPEQIIKTFDVGDVDGSEYNQMVLLKDIEVFSVCEHHMLPFFGRAHVAYIPDKKVVGISKLARLVEVYARRLQIQERICEQVTDALMKYLRPQGAACIIEAQHLCMLMRGVEKQNSIMVTSSLKGCFFDNLHTRNELFSLIGLGGGV